ncbi:glutathione S-transferase, partial [Halomonas sp. ND22Bw]
LLDHRQWIGGATMSLADLAAAAQISIADYLGGIDFKTHDLAKRWYVGMKSRPSFRPLLAERMEGVPPPADYEKLDV